MPHGHIRGIHPGSLIIHRGEKATIPVSLAMIGRVFDGAGVLIDGKGSLPEEDVYPIYHVPPRPVVRRSARTPLKLGAAAMEDVLSCRQGQRVVLLARAGSDVQRLVAATARHAQAAVNVVALVGVQPQQLRDGIERYLSRAGHEKTVIVVSTAEEPALMRLRSGYIATTIAEFFRDQGSRVLLILDSLTRLATAQQEIGQAIGEPLIAGGYTPSVFTLLQLCNRVGTLAGTGSITSLYTMQIAYDEGDDPLVAVTCAIVEGQILVSPENDAVVRDVASEQQLRALFDGAAENEQNGGPQWAEPR